MQPADERECRDFLVAVGDFGQLALKVFDVRFEIVALSHLNGEKIVVVPLSSPVRCVLGKKCLIHLIDVVKRM